MKIYIIASVSDTASNPAQKSEIHHVTAPKGLEIDVRMSRFKAMMIKCVIAGSYQSS